MAPTYFFPTKNPPPPSLPPSLPPSRLSPQTKQTHKNKRKNPRKTKNPQIILHPFLDEGHARSHNCRQGRPQGLPRGPPAGHWAHRLAGRVPPRLLCDPAKQQQSASLIAGMLGAKQGRSLVISIDETCWKASYEAVSRLRGSGISINGGGWSKSKDMAVLTRDDPLPEPGLAKMTISVLVTTADSNKLAIWEGPWQGAHVPGDRRTGRACSNVPPLSVSYDNGSSNTLLNNCLLGLLPFFSGSTVTKVTKIPLFPFGCLTWSPTKQPEAQILRDNRCAGCVSLHEKLHVATPQLQPHHQPRQLLRGLPAHVAWWPQRRILFGT